MKVLVMAAGAVGGYFGARLAKAGRAELTFVARGAHAAAIARDGLAVKSPAGDFSVRVPVVEDPARAEPPDFVLFAVKWKDCREAARRLAPALGTTSAVVCLLNGVDAEPLLAEELGKERVMGGIAYVGAAIEAPGVIRHHGLGRLVLGEIDGTAPSNRLRTLCSLFEGAGVECKAAPDFWSAKWGKLVFNASTNALTALTRKPMGQALSIPEVERLCLQAMKEVVAVGRACGIDLSRFDEQALRESVRYSRSLGDSPTSMLSDALTGKPLEHELLNGAVLRRGQEKGVPTPVNELLYALLEGLSQPSLSGRGPG